jgi:myosin heavy subunit
LITVNFDSHGSIIGGGIINYLLEKSRVVFQTAGERNYHIFYQLISYANRDDDLNSVIQLTRPEDYLYTGQSGIYSINGVSDLKEFEEVRCTHG